MARNNKKNKRKNEAILKKAGANSLKAKGKAKPVKTNLKEINIKTRAQVDRLDEKLKDIQELVTVVKKPDLEEKDCKMEVSEKKSRSASKETLPNVSIKDSVDKVTDLQSTLQIQ